MRQKRDNDDALRQPYISPDNIKDIYLPYNTTQKHTYVNVIVPIVYFNHVGKKGDWKRECVVYGSHKYFLRGLLSEREKNLCLTPHLS